MVEAPPAAVSLMFTFSRITWLQRQAE